MYYLCEKYYRSITAQYYTDNCIVDLKKNSHQLKVDSYVLFGGNS